MSTDPVPINTFDELLRKRDGMALMATAIRLLAAGKPITVGEVARTAGVDVADIAAAPAAGDIEYDNLHRIVGWGLTLNPTPHRYVVDGRLLYTWCAADMLLFPAILGRAARIESPCPTTGTTIRLTVDPEAGIADLDPAGAVMSIPGRDQVDTDRVRETGCNPGRYFAGIDAAAAWIAQNPTGVVLSVADAYERIRPMRDRMTGATDIPAQRSDDPEAPRN
jgi:alkylmercury lyase